MKKFISGIVIIFLTINISFEIFSQNVEFERANFPGKKKELKKARKEIASGDNMLTGKAKKANGLGRYEGALKHYLIAYKLNPNNAILDYKIGFAYMKTVEKYNAVSYLAKAYQLNKIVKKNLPYLLAQAYQFNYEFDKAIQIYSDFKKSLPPESFGEYASTLDKKIQECENGRELIKYPVNVKITNIGNNVNNEFPQYSPIVNEDRTIMFFTARQPNTFGNRKDHFDGKYMEDIYMSYFKNGEWSKPRHPKRPLNSKAHDAIVGIAQNGKTLLTYKVTSKDNGDIFMSKLKNDRFTKPKRLNRNINTAFHESSATMSPDGNTLYFISDREGGFGGRDIWMSTKDSKGNWGKATNLGPTINTSYNEEGVFMQADGKTLYFSSQGHNSMGGYDIFKTTLKDGVWTTPINLGYPINSPDDDVFFSITKDGIHGYYASGKKGGYGDLDIYEIEFIQEKPIEVITFNGKVLDGDTKLPVECKVEITDNSLNTIIKTIPIDNETGDFSVALSNKKPFQINVSATEYIPNKDIVNPDKDLFKIIYIYKPKKVISQIIKGYVYDADTREPICKAFITVKDFETKSVVDTLYNECKTGEYHSKAPIGKLYELNVTAPQYKSHKESVSLDKDVNKTIYIHKIPSMTIGYIFDAETKQPVCYADIDIKNTETNSIEDKLKSECSSGKYQLKLPKGNQYVINIKAPEYIPYSENLSPEMDVNKTIYIQKKPQPIGYVYDADTKLPVCNADIDIINTQTNSSEENLKSECSSGKYQSKLHTGKQYIINVSAPDYIHYTENIPSDMDVNKALYIKKAVYILSGNVYDIDTKQPVCADIEITDDTGKTTADKLKTDCTNGKFQTKVLNGHRYELNTTAPEYVPDIVDIIVTDDVNKITYIKKLKSAIAEGKVFNVSAEKSFVLPDILYDLDKYNLKLQYQDSLNSLISTMRAFPKIVIEIGSHTDTRGSDKHNETLSYNRAKSVVDYLILKGIDPDRLFAKGYGKYIPRVLDKTRFVISCNIKYKFEKSIKITDEFINSLQGGKCEKEAAHQLNRRTEFKVLREDFIQGSNTNKQVKIDVMN